MPVSKMLFLVIPLFPSCRFYLCFLPLKDWRRLPTTPFSFFSVPPKPGGLIAEQTAIGFKIPFLVIGALWQKWYHSGVKCPWNDLLCLFSGSICITPLNSVPLIIRWMFNFLHHWPHQRVLPFKVFPPLIGLLPISQVIAKLAQLLLVYIGEWSCRPTYQKVPKRCEKDEIIYLKRRKGAETDTVDANLST